MIIDLDSGSGISGQSLLLLGGPIGSEVWAELTSVKPNMLSFSWFKKAPERELEVLGCLEITLGHSPLLLAE